MRKFTLLFVITSVTMTGCNRDSAEPSNASENPNQLTVAVALPVTSPAVAENDYSARPSLSAAEHFAAAKAISDLTRDYEDGAEFPTDAAMQAVWHLEQALTKGYPNRKQARILLREMLWLWGASKLECYGYVRDIDPKDPVIQKQCILIVAANERGNNMTPELYQDYPDDPKIVHSYLIWIAAAGAKNAEKEAVLRKSLALTKSPEIEAELAYVLLDEGEFEEAKVRFAEALELQTDEFLLTDKLDRYTSHLQTQCPMPANIAQVINTIPQRYQPTEIGIPAHTVNPNPTKEELEDRQKLAAIKKQVIDAIRQAQCKAPR